jgi:hypothetical protein
MNIVLTMAGKYSRFRLFGSKVPKYLLPLGSETVLAEVIKRLKLASPEVNLLLIANRHDQIFFPIVRSIMRKYEISDTSLIYIDDTSSQLETAMNATELLSLNASHFPIAFANIDTVLFERDNFFSKLSKCSINEGLLDTFKGGSKMYSYARVDSDGKVLDVIDNSVISDYACSGLYGFGSFFAMSSIAETLLKKNSKANFSNLYQEYILQKLNVFSEYTADIRKTVVLGTPEEYVINIHKFK